MSSGLWVNNDGLMLQYGTQKAVPEQGGDYPMPGSNRILECRVNLANLITANATILSNTTYLPAMTNFYVEKVEVVSEVGMSTSSSPTLSIGVCEAALTGGSSTVTIGTNTTYTSASGKVVYDYVSGYTAATNAGTAVTTATIPSNGATAFVNAAAASTLSSAGDLLTLTHGSTAAGSYIGDFQDVTNLTTPMYLTGTLGTATATGIILVRIHYHGVGTISN